MSMPKRVLAVDDQPGIRALLSEALSMAGYQVQCAASGTSALACVEQFVPDLILLDMNMPGVSGLETLRELRRRHPALPVLMVTADESDLSLCRTVDLRISGWILKPFDLNDLYRQVQAAIN